jgi:GT2 family glycosyltransferase
LPESLREYTWVLYVLVVIFIVTAVSNGANITDGLDGLATGVSAIIGMCLAIFAYASGNILLIPKSVVNKIGILDSKFHHALGDYDYTLRAKKSKIDVLVAPGFCGICELHDSIPLWKSGKNIFIRISSLYSPISGCSPNEFFIFDLRHNGVLKALLHFVTIHLRAIFKIS